MFGRIGCGTHEEYKVADFIIDPYWTRSGPGMKTVEAPCASSVPSFR
jgi:hypothetical protein